MCIYVWKRVYRCDRSRVHDEANRLPPITASRLSSLCELCMELHTGTVDLKGAAVESPNEEMLPVSVDQGNAKHRLVDHGEHSSVSQ